MKKIFVLMSLPLLTVTALHSSAKPASPLGDKSVSSSSSKAVTDNRVADAIKLFLDGDNGQARQAFDRCMPSFEDDGSKEKQALKKKASLTWGECCLATGDLKTGFELLRAREADRPKLSKPIDLDEKIALNAVIEFDSEGGFGDGFFFARFMKALKKHRPDVKIVARLRPQEVPVLSNCLVSNGGYIDEIVVKDAKPTLKVDKQVYFMTSPLLVSSTGVEPVTSQTIPTEPHLKADPARVEKWKKILADDPNFKVFVWWRASKLAPGQTSKELQRDIPLSEIEQLAKIPGISVYSIQGCGEKWGHRAVTQEELEKLREAGKAYELDEGDVVKDPSLIKELPGLDAEGPFSDTAALLDCVAQEPDSHAAVGCDTAQACLAEGLEVPAKVAISSDANSDWRWKQILEESAKKEAAAEHEEVLVAHPAWSPSITMYKETGKFNNFEQVMALIRRDLAAQVKGRGVQQKKSAPHSGLKSKSTPPAAVSGSSIPKPEAPADRQSLIASVRGMSYPKKALLAGGVAAASFFGWMWWKRPSQ